MTSSYEELKAQAGKQAEALVVSTQTEAKLGVMMKQFSELQERTSGLRQERALALKAVTDKATSLEKQLSATVQVRGKRKRGQEEQETESLRHASTCLLIVLHASLFSFPLLSFLLLMLIHAFWPSSHPRLSLLSFILPLAEIQPHERPAAGLSAQAGSPAGGRAGHPGQVRRLLQDGRRARAPAHAAKPNPQDQGEEGGKEGVC
jgi:hypothetical protein